LIGFLKRDIVLGKCNLLPLGMDGYAGQSQEARWKQQSTVLSRSLVMASKYA
jgi:hypothetical protein